MHFYNAPKELMQKRWRAINTIDRMKWTQACSDLDYEKEIVLNYELDCFFFRRRLCIFHLHQIESKKTFFMPRYFSFDSCKSMFFNPLNEIIEFHICNWNCDNWNPFCLCLNWIKLQIGMNKQWQLAEVIELNSRLNV